MKKILITMLAVLSLALGALAFAACQPQQQTEDPGSGPQTPAYEILEVTFQNGEASFVSKVVKGQRVAQPEDPENTEVSYFVGWYHGNEPYDFSLPVQEDMTLTAHFQQIPLPEGTLTGTVTDTAGTPIAGAQVSSDSVSTVTDRYGRYGLDIPKAQACRLRISAPGYNTVIRWLPPASAAGTLDVVLDAAGSTMNRDPAAADLRIALNAYVTVYLTRQESMLLVRYEVYDSDITTYAVTDNTDDVTLGDRVEFYIDTEGNGGSFPAEDDWQINIDANGYFRYCRGNGSIWLFTDNFVPYTIVRYTDGDGSSVGYSVEMTFSYADFGLQGDSAIHFALGQSGYSDVQSRTNWIGWTYNGKFTDPQVPAKYQVWQADGTFLSVEGKPFTVDERYLEELAVIEADKKSLTERGAMMFTDDIKNMLAENLPDSMIGTTSFVLAPVSRSKWSVAASGYVILFAPAVGYGSLGEELLDDGWQLIAENGYSIGRDTKEFTDLGLNNVYVRYCDAGESFFYNNGWTLPFGAPDADGDYYVFEYEKAENFIITRNAPEDETVMYNGVASSVAVTEDILVVAYGTGGRWEPDVGNYTRVKVSYDGGKSFQTAFTVRNRNPDIRYTDPYLYLNRDGVLIFAVNQTNAYFSGLVHWYQVCIPNPTDPVEEWEIGTPYCALKGICMNKPVELEDGSLLIPVHQNEDPNYSYIYRSTDKGITWTLYSKAYLGNRTASFAHEGNIARLPNGKLWLQVRATAAAYYECYSSDNGLTWTTGQASKLVGAKSRAQLKEIPGTDQILFISNADSMVRGHLTAYILSNDGSGPVIESSLLLDGRSGAAAAGVAYPDVSFLPNGKIFITWDYDRTGAGLILGCLITIDEIAEGGTLSADRIFTIAQNTN